MLSLQCKLVRFHTKRQRRARRPGWETRQRGSAVPVCVDSYKERKQIRRMGQR